MNKRKLISAVLTGCGIFLAFMTATMSDGVKFKTIVLFGIVSVLLMSSFFVMEYLDWEVKAMAEEKQFENKVKKFLKEQGCYFIKYWGGGQFTKAGIPDIICCCNGYFVGVELKSSIGRPSKLQLYNLEKIEESGGYSMVLYPENFEVFKSFIFALNSGFNRNATHFYNELKEVTK